MFKFLEKLFNKSSVNDKKTKEELLAKSEAVTTSDRNPTAGVPDRIEIETVAEEKLPLYDENGDIIAEDYSLAEGVEEGDDR